MRRFSARAPLAALAAVALVAVVPAAGAAGPVRVSGIDASGYPELRVTVVAPPGAERPTLAENGIPVAGAHASNLGRSKSVVLAVDHSRSMLGRPMADAIAGARAFVGSAGENDQLELVVFASRAVPLTRLSAPTALVDAELTALRADRRQGTALWDAVVLAADHLADESGQGRVIVLLTDGSDVSSTATFEQAVAAAQKAGASVHAIAIPGRDFTPEPLRELAERTGGGFHQVSSSSQLVALYRSLSSELARTWELRYPTAARPGEALELTAGVAGAGTAARTVTLDVDSGSAAGSSPSLLPASAWRSDLAPFAISLAVGVLVLLACLFWFSARVGSSLRRRLDPHVERAQRRGRKRGTLPTRSVLRSIVISTERMLAGIKQFRSLQLLLVRADLPLRAAELLYVCGGIGFVVLLVGIAIGLPALFTLLVACALAAVPVFFVKMKAGARLRSFDNQLPDLLIGIAASLKAGHSFRQAMQSMVDEGAEPASKEFARVLAETRLGRPIDDALGEMASRVGSKNLTFVMTAVTIQRQIGGSLAGLFDMVGETVRERQQFARKIRGLTAMGRMSAWVLTGLPIFLALAITALNPSYMAPLMTTSTGRFMVVTGILMIVFGTLVLKRIVSFKG